MLGYFPEFYEDELLYSIIARYHMVSGNQNYKTTLNDIFNCGSQIPILEFVSNLSALINKLPVKFELESKNIIQKHTMFPLYFPFLPEERKQSLIKTILYGDGKGIKTKLGMVSGSICQNNDLIYCPLCSKEEYEKYGEAYFHRLHHAQGIMVCPIHRCFLKKYPVIRSTQSRVEYIKFDNSIIDQKVEYVMSNNDMLIQVAENVMYILNNDLDNFNQEKVHEKYKELLRKKGFLSINDRIKQREVYEEFKCFFGEDLLNILQSNIDYSNEYNWLKVLLRKSKRVVHPLRQVLFIMFICGSTKQFFTDDIHAYNKPKYPCLNHFCESYHKLNIDDYKITADYKTREPVITIRCTCGFVYSRKVNKDIYTIGRVKEYGALWEKNLYHLLREEKYSLRSLARMMKCDPKTIVRYAEKLGLKKLINTKMCISYKEDRSCKNINVDSSKYKEDIINYIRNNNEAIRKDIKTNLYKQYMWLYKNDKQWLNENLPIKKKMNSNIEYNRVDWDKRDKDILVLLKEQYESLIAMEKRPRITKSIIARKAGKSAMLDRYIDKLPECKKYINEIIETVEKYQIYRINNVVKNMIIQGEELKRWKIIRNAGLKKEFTEKVSREIDMNIQKYGIPNK